MRIVVKLGGEILTPDKKTEAEAIAQGVGALVKDGHSVVLIHGGGPQTTALQKRLGQRPNIVGGRRITDDDTLEVVKMVVGGKLNIDFCSLLSREGVRPIGLNGASARVIAAVKRPPRVVSGCGDDPVDFGHVGDVVGINHALVASLLDGGYVPVLACIGSGECGEVYNINADVVATGVAVALGAERVFLVTGTPGVLRDVNDPSTRVARLNAAEARAAIEDGTIAGGMIPKVEESLCALARGVGGIDIVGRLTAGDLLRAAAQPGSVGTALIP